MMEKVYVIGKDSVPPVFSPGAGESLDVTLLVLPGVSCDVKLKVELLEEGAEVFLRGLYLCNSTEKVHIDVDMRHEAGGCVSRQLFKGVVGGKAEAAFHGLIYVRRDSQKTKAYQENHNILLSEGAKVDTKPQLEIYADDVECSHGATIGRLSEEELFYMRSRGIPRNEARRLQIISFISEVVEHLKDESLKAEIYDKLSEC